MTAWTRRRVLTVAGTTAAIAAGIGGFEPREALGAAAAAPLPPPLPADVFRDRQGRLRAAAKARGIEADLRHSVDESDLVGEPRRSGAASA